MTKKTISATVDEAVYNKIADTARDEDRTVSAQIARILRQWANDRPSPFTADIQ